MSRPRVLLCLTSLDPTQGGIASVNRNVVRALPPADRSGREVDVRALVYHGDTPRLAPGYWQKPGSFVAEGFRSNRWRFLNRYFSVCQGWRPDLVFVDHLHLAVIPYLFRWLLPRGYVLFCHGTEFDGGLTRLRRAAFRSAALRLSNSKFTANRLMKLFPGTSVEPCELGLDDLALPKPDEGTVPALLDAYGEPRQMGEQVVLIVGRVLASERYKGHDQLIAVLPELVKQLPEAQLVIAGAGDDLERLKSLACEKGVGHTVLFAGFASPVTLAALFARCRVFAMPSRGEGFGLVYLEAMRFGKPCIASRADAGGEVVADGLTGLVVDPTNLGELHGTAVRLLTDDELAGQLGRAGQERLEQRYGFTHFQERLRGRLAQVLPELAPSEPVFVRNFA
jgi:phosphatidylinositol alpha-1,6-mannosyltransferase